ncbi:MAG: hypothetical protein ACYC6O_00130 [Thermoleophilia bacterium]
MFDIWCCFLRRNVDSDSHIGSRRASKLQSAGALICLLLLLIFTCMFGFAESIARANPSDLWVFGTDMPVSADAGESGYCEDYPAVSGNLVVWQQCFEGNGPSRIYFKDLGSSNPEQPLVDVRPFHYNQHRPAVSSNLVVWTEEVVSSSNYPFEGQVIEEELYGIDIQSGDSPRLIAHGTSISGRAVSGRRIVWAEGNPANPGSSYIFLYDFDTEIKQLVSDGPRDGSPDIDGDWVVWTDFNSDGRETHGINIAAPEARHPQLDRLTLPRRPDKPASKKDSWQERQG